MNALRAMEGHLCALYESDSRGRLIGERAPSERAAPRFHLARTPLGNLWRLRADLSRELLLRLTKLASRENAFADEAQLPEREEFMRRVLEESEPIASFWAGPVFAVPEALVALPGSRARICELTLADAERMDAGLGLSPRDLARPGCLGAEVAGRIVAVCECARGDGSGPSEAGVITAPEQRGNGYGAAVVRAWCDWVRACGGEPFYSTSWDNAASRALAARLGFLPIGEDRHWH